MFNTYLQEKKASILAALDMYIATQKSQNNIAETPWGTDALQRIAQYAQNGKMIRGALVFLGYCMQKKEIDEECIKLALATEIMSSAILIHDDIIDNADLRRGKPSIHTAYTELMTKQNSRYPKNTGKSLGICVGDASFFLGYQLLSELTDEETTKPIIHLFSKEYTLLTYAQMQDVVLGSSSKEVKNIGEILSLYKNKTARYSVLLPLTAGATLANANEATIKHLAKFSENIGIAYQLVDDRLDLFGDPKATGKTVGTDIKEGKQTPYIFFLRQLGDETITTHIGELFAKGEITPDDIAWVKEQVKKHHIDKKIIQMIEEYKKSAMEAIERIPMREEEKELFGSFVEYLTNRIQ